MRIKCPECESVLSLNQPKPGLYRPTCKRCSKRFRLKVSEEDPPKVTVGRDAKASPESAQKAASAKKAAVKASQTVSAGASGAAAAAAGGVHATVDASDAATPVMDAKIQETATSETQATIDTAAGTDQTMLESRKHGAARTVGNVDSTVDEAVDGVSVSSSAGSDRSSSAAPVVSAGPSAGRDAASKSSEDSDIPEKLGGYRILRLLGRGAMGAVYEAKQISLDRLVALKTIRGRLADNASSLARFTREAYAAAQLTHHNVVQIYDFGEDDGKHFFSMEWVRGGPLSDVVQDKGAIDPRLAAGYTLQAARGLQFAHRNGMVHRDVKPANLLLSDEGVVKVADLGLVKIPDPMDPESDVGASSMSGLESGTQVTMQGTAVGTPAYMAPEQGVDAAGVDHRADIYSLGCTLFFLLTGRPPFDGSVVSEVMQQHAKEPIPDLADINSRVPNPLQEVVERSMAKRPEDRYGSLAEMIADLERFLGVNAEGKFSPSAGQADQWEELAGKYAAATPLLRLTGPIFVGFATLCGLLTVVMPFVGLSWLLFGPLLLVSAAATSLLLGAGGGQSAVVNGFRRWIGSLSWFDYAVGILGAVVFLLVSFVSGAAVGVVVGAILGSVCGAAYHFLLVAPTRRKSADAVAEAERFIRNLRIEGADEDGVRLFAARYGGKSWQGLFEALFGYQALCNLRQQLESDPNLSASARRRTLRDKVCESLAGKAIANQQVRDHKRLAKIEQRGLQSEGLSAAEARERAWQMAAAVMDHAKASSAPDTDADAAARAKRERMKAMLADARSGKYKKQRDKFAVLRFALGGQTRLLAGCVLLGIFAIWAQQTGLLDQVKTIAESGIQSGSIDQSDVAALQSTAAGADSDSGRSWSIGIAGLLLAMSAFVSGWRMTPFAVVATLVILLGPTFGIPGIGESLKPWMVSALVGVAVYVPGVIFGEKKEF